MLRWDLAHSRGWHGVDRGWGRNQSITLVLLVSASDQPAEMRAAAAINADAKSDSRARIEMSAGRSLYNLKIVREPATRAVRRNGPGCHPLMGPLGGLFFRASVNELVFRRLVNKKCCRAARRTDRIWAVVASHSNWGASAIRRATTNYFSSSDLVCSNAFIVINDEATQVLGPSCCHLSVVPPRVQYVYYMCWCAG